MDVTGSPETLGIVEAPDQSLFGGHGVELGDEVRHAEPRRAGDADLVGLEAEVYAHVFRKVVLGRLVGNALLRLHLATELVDAGKFDEHRSDEVVEPEFQLAKIEPVLLGLRGGQLASLDDRRELCRIRWRVIHGER